MSFVLLEIIRMQLDIEYSRAIGDNNDKNRYILTTYIF